MNKHYYSHLFPEIVEKEEKKTSLKKLIDWLTNEDEKRIQPLLYPNREDIETVLNATPEINSHFIQSATITDGILYVNCNISIKAEFRSSSTPESVARGILLRLQNHWFKTKQLEIHPFIPTITAKNLTIATPISRFGYKTLANIQLAQNAFMTERIEKDSQKEARRAKALNAMKERRGK